MAPYPPQGGGFPESRRVMLFIDGGYLRRKLDDLERGKEWDVGVYVTNIFNNFSSVFRFELIRAYYYDAICEKEKDPELYEQSRKLFDSIDQKDNIEVKKGTLIISQKRKEQKGVDILIAIDMLTKAYNNHYDVAILLCGDRDFIPLIRAVKDMTGKRMYGVSIEKCPDELKRQFDKHYEIQRGSGLRNLFGITS